MTSTGCHKMLCLGFRVFLTSDHGNIEARGCGRPAEGAVADLRGERVRVYPDPVLRGKIKERGLRPCTYAQLYEQVSGMGRS
ncbi:MAG: hypothetical protein HQ580_05520 [Planctomycetes bacterium]|nr:hypothetical protein [Planctomycetota bacterium]